MSREMREYLEEIATEKVIYSREFITEKTETEIKNLSDDELIEFITE